jgi:hypothetical protein
MSTSKQRRLGLLASFGLLIAGVVLSSPQVFANPPEPQCVCAECGTPCGSGHTAACSAKAKS